MIDYNIQKKVSVIIPVYNAGRYLKQCLNSVSEQTLKEIEIIIVNDCSPNPNDEKTCLEYQEKYPQINYIKNKKNQGLFISRMVGIEAACGEYIGFVDADDFVEVAMYDSMYREAIKNNVDILEIYITRVKENGEKIAEFEYGKPNVKYSKQPFHDIIDKIKWNTCNKIYKKEVIKKAVKLMPKKRISMGEDLLLNIIIFYFSRTYILLEKPFYNYRENTNSSITGTLGLKEKIEDLIQVHTQYEKIFKSLLNNNIFNEISIKIINHIKEAIIYYTGSNIIDQIIVKNIAYDFFKQNNQNTDFFTDFKLKSPSTLNIGLIGYTSNGGAGIATQRLHQGLLDTHINSSFFLLRGVTKTLEKSNYYIDIPKKQNFNLTYLSNKNIYPGNTIFSLSYPSLSFSDLNVIVKNNDIINLHWIPRILSTEAIAYLSHSNRPIVWTFHDKNPLTGGCHYFHGCENWETNCMNCPQLIDNYDNYPAKILAAKKKYINFKNITVVVLNQHFKKLVEQSPLFNDSRIEVIPNSIDTDRFVPLDKKQMRKKLGLDENKKYLLYVSAYVSEIKGYKEFEQTTDEYEKQYSSDNIEILLVGNLPKDRNIKLPVKEFGHVDEDKIIELYSASDVTVLSSIEDNLPNIILESFSCGTPIVGFKVGGLPDMIEDSYNGYTVELGDIKGLAGSINKVLDGKDLSKNCREYAEENLRLEIQAKRYKALYEDLLSKPVKATGGQDSVPEVFLETAPTVIKFLNESISITKLKIWRLEKKNKDLYRENNRKEKRINDKDHTLERRRVEIERLQNIEQEYKELLIVKKNFNKLKTSIASLANQPIKMHLIKKIEAYKHMMKVYKDIENKNHTKIENNKIKQPNISIVTVVYNGEKEIETTLRSISEQTYKNIEYIIIDGASNDNTLKIINTYKGNIDKIISEKDSGIYDAMNKGIDLASGKWINFMNAGDTFADNNTLSKIVENIEENTDVIYGDRYYVKNDKKTLQKAKSIDTVFEKMPFGHQSVFVKNEVIKKFKFNDTYKFAADYNLLIQLYIKQYSFQYIPIPVCNFISGGHSESGLRPYLEVLKILFDNCKDHKIIEKNIYLDAFRNNCENIINQSIKK